MALNDVFYDSQSEARSSRRAAAARIGAVEPAREMRDVFWGYSFAPVGHHQSCALIASFGKLNAHIGFRMAVFEGVIDKVAHQLLQLLSVATHNSGIVKRQLNSSAAIGSSGVG